MIGHDHDRDERRTFRVDRFEGGPEAIVVGEPGSFERPASFDPRAAFPADPKQIGHDADDGIEAQILIDAARAGAVERELGADRVVERRADGSIVVVGSGVEPSGVPVVGARAARARRRARPATVRAHIVDWLTAFVVGTADVSGPRNAEDRLRRLLVMLPWLMEVGEVALGDVARRFDMTEAQVQTDLELVAMCGLPPFVDEMIDVFVDDGMVFVGVPRLFTRPLRLTAPEGFSLLSSARAAMELPGADPDGPLGRGLEKLARALIDAGVDAGTDDTAGVVVDLARPPLTDDLAEAAAQGSELAIRYYTPARDEITERRIVPRHVFVETGNWYVLADDERSGERRTFRIDRIESADPTGVVAAVDETVAAADPVLRRRRRPPRRAPARSRSAVGARAVSGRRGHRTRRSGRLGRGASAGVERPLARQVVDPPRCRCAGDRPRRRGRRASNSPGGCSTATTRRTAPVARSR